MIPQSPPAQTFPHGTEINCLLPIIPTHCDRPVAGAESSQVHPWVVSREPGLWQILRERCVE